jgi:hypothetical protein
MIFIKAALSHQTVGIVSICRRVCQPQLLKDQGRGLVPEMNENSRCAAAFDSSSDPARMLMKCSIHIRNAAEGARRALRYCEDDRQRRGVRASCRVVQR